jgi:hypothetical protein
MNHGTPTLPKTYITLASTRFGKGVALKAVVERNGAVVRRAANP